MVNLVTIEGKKYMVDVGFGAREPTQPVPLEHGHEITTIAPARGRLELKHVDRQVTKDDPAQRVWVWCHSRKDGGGWEDMYSFLEPEVFAEDFEALNYFVMTRPQSFFLQTVLAYRRVLDEATGDELVGEVILHDNVVKERAGGQERVLEVLETEEDRVRALERYFDMRLTEREKRAIKGLPTELKGKKAE
jgi:arylamine N-acetyltransferase